MKDIKLFKKTYKAPAWFTEERTRLEGLFDEILRERGRSWAWWEEAKAEAKTEFIASLLPAERRWRFLAAHDLVQTGFHYLFLRWQWENLDRIGEVDFIGYDKEKEAIITRRGLKQMMESLGVQLRSALPKI